MLPIPSIWKNRPFCLAVLFILLLTGTSCHSLSQGNNTGKDTIPPVNIPAPPHLARAEIDRLNLACTAWYDSALKQTGFNGGILIARKGQVVFERYHGTGHLPGTDTINENTPLHIASTSKTFTAMAVLKLMQEGKLSLDDEFGKYFPEFNYPGLTIRDLLNHRSGLPNYIYFMENLGWNKLNYVTNADVLNYLVTRKAELENIGKPGVHFSYSNTNFALLALLVEKITGSPFPEHMKKTFFDPLQMKHTFVFTLADSERMKPSYDWKGRIMPMNFLDLVYGDKNIYTTPRDLLTWDRALAENLIFTRATLEQAYAPYSNEKPGIKNYGLGWRMDIYPDGRKIIFHNGWWHGSNCTFIRLLQDSATIIAIGNKFSRSIYHTKILANLFGQYYSTPDDDEGDINKSTDSLIDKTTVIKKQRAVTGTKKDLHRKKNSP